jgi:glycerate 2-kinase
VPREVVASDKFKGSLTAPQVCAALATGIAGAHPDCDVVELPVADGGEGTVLAAVRAGFTPAAVVVGGPTGDPVTATYARRADLAVVELAEALDHLDARHAEVLVTAPRSAMIVRVSGKRATRRMA